MKINGQTQEEYEAQCPEWATAADRETWNLLIAWVFDDYATDEAGAYRRFRSHLDAMSQIKSKAFNEAARNLGHRLFAPKPLPNLEDLAMKVVQLRQAMAETETDLEHAETDLFEAVCGMKLGNKFIRLDGYCLHINRESKILIEPLYSITKIAKTVWPKSTASEPLPFEDEDPGEDIDDVPPWEVEAPEIQLIADPDGYAEAWAATQEREAAAAAMLEE